MSHYEVTILPPISSVAMILLSVRISFSRYFLTPPAYQNFIHALFSCPEVYHWSSGQRINIDEVNWAKPCRASSHPSTKPNSKWLGQYESWTQSLMHISDLFYRYSYSKLGRRKLTAWWSDWSHDISYSIWAVLNLWLVQFQELVSREWHINTLYLFVGIIIIAACSVCMCKGNENSQQRDALDHADIFLCLRIQCPVSAWRNHRR